MKSLTNNPIMQEHQLRYNLSLWTYFPEYLKGVTEEQNNNIKKLISSRLYEDLILAKEIISSIIKEQDGSIS